MPTSGDDRLGRQNIVDDKLINMTNKILNMRKKLDSVNTRFAFIRHELSDEHEYVAKLAKIKEVLEEQESILKKEVVEIAHNVLKQRCASTIKPISHTVQEIAKEEDYDVNSGNWQKYQKENFNKMMKLRNEIEEMRKFEEFQMKRLKELQRIKGIIFRLISVDDCQDI